MPKFPLLLLRMLVGIVMSGGLLSVCAAADLWDIYQIARTADAQYQVANYEYQRAKLALPLAKSALRPAITVQGSGGKVRGTDSTDSSRTTRNNQISLNAELPLFDRALWSEVARAKSQVELATVRFDEAQDALILKVAERYFQLLSARNNKEVAVRQKVAIERQMQLASERLAVGLGTHTDLFDAQARFQQAVADVIRADNMIDNNEQSLKQIIGVAPARLAVLSENAPLPQPDPQAVGVWVKQALENNLALRAANLNLEIAAKEIKKQQAARWPSLGLGVVRQKRYASDNSEFVTGPNSTVDSTTLNATLQWPLFLGGSIHTKIKQSALQFNIAEQSREALRRQTEAETTSAYLAVVSGISQVNALSEAIRAGASALTGKEQGFRAGLTTNLDVLDAQRDLAGSRTEYWRAKYDFILSWLYLEQAVGDLDENDLKRINAWLVSQ